jgi:DNA-binding CsgD family transcriptional regulator
VTRGLHAGLFEEVSRIATGLCALARPGETLVSGGVHDLCSGSGFRFEDRGEVRLAGIGSPVRCYRLQGKVRSPAKWPEPPFDVPDRLSPRELEVLRLIALGRTNQEIAEELVVSLSTVTTHVRTIFEKTEVANRAEAASYAYRHRLIRLPDA